MRRGARCLASSCPRTSLSAPLPSASCQPHARHLFGIDLEKIKKFDEQRKKRKWEKRDAMSANHRNHSPHCTAPHRIHITASHRSATALLSLSLAVTSGSRQEIRALPIRQMQVLLSEKKPLEIATPLHLTPAPLAPLFMPPSPPCIAVTCEKQEVLLPQQFWGKLTFLHLSFNQFTFDWGRKWCEAAMEFAAMPLSATPIITPPLSPFATASASSPSPTHPALASDPAAASPPPPPPPAGSSEGSPFDYYQISLIKNPFVRHWFGDYSLSSFRSTTPQPTHRHLLSLLTDQAYTALTAQEATLQLWRHELLGFVFLLDARGRIRWRAWGNLMEGDREVLGRMVRELREEDRAERRREERERGRGKEAAGMEQQRRMASSGVKSGQVYSAGKVNGQQQLANGGVNGVTNGVKAVPSSSSGGVRVETQSEKVASERVEKVNSAAVGEATAVAKG